MQAHYGLPDDGADRHGRFRRRHTQVSAAPPDRADHAGGRLRQDRQARRRPPGSPLAAARRSICPRLPSCSPSAARAARWSIMRAAPPRRTRCCSWRGTVGLPLADDVAAEGSSRRFGPAGRREHARGHGVRSRRSADRPRRGLVIVLLSSRRAVGRPEPLRRNPTAAVNPLTQLRASRLRKS